MTCERLFEMCCEESGLDLSSRKKTSEYVYYRCIYFKLALEMKFSCVASARIADRTHASAINAVKNTFETIRPSKWNHDKTWYNEYLRFKNIIKGRTQKRMFIHTIINQRAKIKAA